jgi:sugar-phosphatase
VHELGCESLLFDLDGVLIDSKSCFTRHWTEWAERHGVDVARVLGMAHGVRTVETMRIVAPHLDADKEAERFNANEIADTEGVIAVDGALGLLEGLPAERWAVVTSGSRELAEARIRRAGLPLPQTMVCADDVSQGKPAPEPYLEAARRLGQRVVDCIAVEDAPAGIESAHGAGMQVVAVTSTHTRAQLTSPFVIDRLSDMHVNLTARGSLILLVNPGRW